jgi:hypothetical protein
MTTRVIDQNVVTLVGLALKQRHQITACPQCDGPFVRSKSGMLSRGCGCGHVNGVAFRRCWSCGTAMTPGQRSSVVALANANGRANVEAMAPWHTCPDCSGQAEALVVRQSWRTCERCKGSLAGQPRPSRGADVCPGCRTTVRRLRNRETARLRAGATA